MLLFAGFQPPLKDKKKKTKRDVTSWNWVQKWLNHITDADATVLPLAGKLSSDWAIRLRAGCFGRNVTPRTCSNWKQNVSGKWMDLTSGAPGKGCTFSRWVRPFIVLGLHCNGLCFTRCVTLSRLWSCVTRWLFGCQTLGRASRGGNTS